MSKSHEAEINGGRENDQKRERPEEERKGAP